MAGFIHRDQILEKLEIARTIGLVTDFAVGLSGSARRPEASVEAWRHPNASDETVQDYLTGLLSGLVPAYQITVRPPVGASAEASIDPVPVSA
jgi:hypothetical protein